MAIGKTNAGGSSGSGGTLTVTGIAGDIVTVSKDGKTYTRTFNSSGVAVFKGLSTGTWTVTMTNSAGQTATRTVEITADYSLTIAYFSATIAITYPANSACIIKNSSGVQVASDTNAGTSEKTWTAIVGATGTYTIIATVMDSSGKTKSTTVSITTDGQSESVTLTYGLYIFKNGSGLTSGYSIKSNSMTSAPTVSSDTISWSGNSSSGGVAFYIDPAVALSGYTKLCVDFECSYNYGGNYGMGFGVGTDAAASTTINNTNWTAKVTSTAQGAIARNTVQCDISALTDSEYIKVVGSYSAGKIYNIWLE